MLPATLHVDEPSPHVDWSMGSVQLLTEPRPWQANGRPRRAGVSSFGISGTNAHVIIESAPPAEHDRRKTAVRLPAVVPWVLSAKSTAALASQASRLAEFVGGPRRFGAGRRGMVPGGSRHLRASGRGARCRPRRTADRSGRRLADGQPGASVITGTGLAGKTVFVFPGQGSQWLGMGMGLHATLPGLRRGVQHSGRRTGSPPVAPVARGDVGPRRKAAEHHRIRPAGAVRHRSCAVSPARVLGCAARFRDGPLRSAS